MLSYHVMGSDNQVCKQFLRLSFRKVLFPRDTGRTCDVFDILCPSSNLHFLADSGRGSRPFTNMKSEATCSGWRNRTPRDVTVLSCVIAWQHKCRPVGFTPVTSGESGPLHLLSVTQMLPND